MVNTPHYLVEPGIFIGADYDKFLVKCGVEAFQDYSNSIIRSILNFWVDFCNINIILR